MKSNIDINYIMTYDTLSVLNSKIVPIRLINYAFKNV